MDFGLIGSGILSEVNKFSNMGFTDFTKEKNWIWDKESWTKDTGNSIMQSLIDPGKAFFDFGGSKKKKGPPKIAGKTQDQWIDELSMTDDEFNQNLTSLFRTLSTGAAESRNRNDEIAARENLPAATQLAAERGVNIARNEAAMIGQEQLTLAKENLDRSAKQFVMQLFAQKESNDEAYLRLQEQNTQNSMNQLLSSLGSYLSRQYFSGNNASEINLGGGNFIDLGKGSTYEPYQYYGGE